MRLFFITTSVSMVICVMLFGIWHNKSFFTCTASNLSSLLAALPSTPIQLFEIVFAAFDLTTIVAALPSTSTWVLEIIMRLILAMQFVILIRPFLCALWHRLSVTRLGKQTRFDAFTKGNSPSDQNASDGDDSEVEHPAATTASTASGADAATPGRRPRIHRRRRWRMPGALVIFFSFLLSGGVTGAEGVGSNPTTTDGTGRSAAGTQGPPTVPHEPPDCVDTNDDHSLAGWHERRREQPSPRRSPKKGPKKKGVKPRRGAKPKIPITAETKADDEYLEKTKTTVDNNMSECRKILERLVAWKKNRKKKKSKKIQKEEKSEKTNEKKSAGLQASTETMTILNTEERKLVAALATQAMVKLAGCDKETHETRTNASTVIKNPARMFGLIDGWFTPGKGNLVFAIYMISFFFSVIDGTKRPVDENRSFMDEFDEGLKQSGPCVYVHMPVVTIGWIKEVLIPFAEKTTTDIRSLHSMIPIWKNLVDGKDVKKVVVFVYVGQTISTIGARLAQHRSKGATVFSTIYNLMNIGVNSDSSHSVHTLRSVCLFDKDTIESVARRRDDSVCVDETKRVLDVAETIGMILTRSLYAEGANGLNIKPGNDGRNTRMCDHISAFVNGKLDELIGKTIDQHTPEQLAKLRKGIRERTRICNEEKLMRIAGIYAYVKQYFNPSEGAAGPTLNDMLTHMGEWGSYDAMVSLNHRLDTMDRKSSEYPMLKALLNEHKRIYMITGASQQRDRDNGEFSSRFIGVSLQRVGDKVKWLAQCYIHQTKICVGRYDDEQEAAEMHNAALRYYGVEENSSLFADKSPRFNEVADNTRIWEPNPRYSHNEADKSTCVGVRWAKHARKWRVVINGKHHGYFNTEKEAAEISIKEGKTNVKWVDRAPGTTPALVGGNKSKACLLQGNGGARGQVVAEPNSVDAEKETEDEPCAKEPGSSREDDGELGSPQNSDEDEEEAALTEDEDRPRQLHYHRLINAQVHEEVKHHLAEMTLLAEEIGKLMVRVEYPGGALAATASPKIDVQQANCKRRHEGEENKENTVSSNKPRRFS
jgi:hypothetical protein